MIKKIFRTAMTILSVIFLLWFIAPVFYRVINPGNILGIAICLILIFRFGFYKKYFKLKARLCSNTAVKVLWRAVQVCCIIFAVYAAAISGLMIYCSSIPPVENSTAVVLGAQVRNGKASTPLMQRINAGVKYLNENEDASAVVTGGQGDDEAMSEAECMLENMTGDGIDESRIYVEDKAENTEQNIKYSYEIIKENDLNKNLAVVTDSYHQLRARLIAKKQGINTQIGAINTINNMIGLLNYPTFFVREWIAIPVELLK